MLFSEPKIPQLKWLRVYTRINDRVSVLFSEPKIPQPRNEPDDWNPQNSFSALQRAENSSSYKLVQNTRVVVVSVLFSEPKIPQPMTRSLFSTSLQVSVLFSEPKIPQSPSPGICFNSAWSFSALQRAENSSKPPGTYRVERWRVSVLFSEPKIPQGTVLGGATWSRKFQCSSASRKFLNGNDRTQVLPELMFQCSSASRKFLNVNARRVPRAR